MPEPELIISIGDQDTLAGFSPWHIRLSEIMYDFTLTFFHHILILSNLIFLYIQIEKSNRSLLLINIRFMISWKDMERSRRDSESSLLPVLLLIYLLLFFSFTNSLS